jgi:hypothetical protein
LTSQLFEEKTGGGKRKKKISHKGGEGDLLSDEFAQYSLSRIKKQIIELGIKFDEITTCESLANINYKTSVYTCSHPIIIQHLNNFFGLTYKLFNIYPILKETYKNKRLFFSIENLNILEKIVRRLYWQNAMNGFKKYLDAQKKEDTLINISQPKSCQNNVTDTNTHILFFKSKTISTIKLTNIDNTLVQTNNVKLHVLHFDDPKSSTIQIKSFLSCLSTQDNVFITLSTVDFDATNFIKIMEVLENIISQIKNKGNVTVLNETNLWLLHNDTRTHKVLNCIPFKESKTIPDGTIFLIDSTKKYMDFIKSKSKSKSESEIIGMISNDKEYGTWLKNSNAKKTWGDETNNLNHIVYKIMHYYITNPDSYNADDKYIKFLLQKIDKLDALYLKIDTLPEYKKELNIKDYNTDDLVEYKDKLPPPAYLIYNNIVKEGKMGVVVDATSYPYKYEGKTYLIHTIESHYIRSPTVNTTDSFFVSYCLRSPSCGRNRLYQVDGTCWFSAIINCFILTDSLKVLWHGKNVESITYDNFIQYLKKAFKTVDLNANFTKGIVSKTIFDNFDDNAKRSIFIDFFNKIKNGMKVHDHIILPLSYLIRKTTSNGVVYNGFDYLIHLLKPLEYIEKKVDHTLTGFGCIDYFIHTLTNKRVQDCPDIVLFASPGLSELPREIIGGSGNVKIKYKLACSVMLFTLDNPGRTAGNVQRDDNHAISGLFCNDEPYIYNSWNITGRNAHWYKGFEWEHVGNYIINYSRLYGDKDVLDYFGPIEDPISLSEYDVVVYTIV